MEDFNHWLAMLPHQHKVVIAGNHDAHADGSPTAVTAAAAAAASLQTRLTAATFLSDSGVSLLGMRLWGAPWQVRIAMASKQRCYGPQGTIVAAALKAGSHACGSPFSACGAFLSISSHVS